MNEPSLMFSVKVLRRMMMNRGERDEGTRTEQRDHPVCADVDGQQVELWKAQNTSGLYRKRIECVQLCA